MSVEGEVVELDDGTTYVVHGSICTPPPPFSRPLDGPVEKMLDPFEVAKFNPYHDSLGRFSTASGATATTPAPTAQGNIEAIATARRFREGATYSVRNKHFKHKGKAFSPYPERSREIPLDKFNAEEVRVYMDDHSDLLSKPNHYLGKWLDPDTGLVWLDVSVVVRTHEEAVEYGTRANQKAYYDLDTGDTIPLGGTGYLSKFRSALRRGTRRAGDSRRVDDGRGDRGVRDGGDAGRLDPFGLSAVKKFNPHHDDLGRFTSGPGSSSTHTSRYFDEDGKPIIHTDDMTTAVSALVSGQKVVLSERKQVSTLLDKLAAMVRAAEKQGLKAPTFDLCGVSVRGTNVFCAQSKGIPRIKMPQLSGKPIPGSRADSLPKNHKGEVDLSSQFRDRLLADGVKVTSETERADFLKASQNELNGGKVAGMAKALRAGTLPKGAIFVSRDNYVVDGHHRWAATVGVDFRDNRPGDLTMDVTRVDLPILDVLKRANDFAAEYGIPQAGVSKAVVEPPCVGCSDAERERRSAVWAIVQKFNPNHHPAGSPKGGQFATADGGWGDVDSGLGDDLLSPGAEHGPTFSPTGKRSAPDNPRATFMDSMPPKFLATQLAKLETVGLTYDDLVSNIEALFLRARDEFPEVYALGLHWYEEANSRIGEIAAEFGIDKTVAIGMTAAMSPSSEWSQNVAMVRELALQHTQNLRVRLTPEEVKSLCVRGNKHADALIAAVGKDGVGPQFNSLPPEQAAWAFMVTGQRKGLLAEGLTPDGNPIHVQFATGARNIAKAIKIARGENISKALGGMHKIRSFFNNIKDPTNASGRDDITIDTHAASVAQAFRMPMVSQRADRTFWNGSSKSSNQNGLYPIYADAYRAVAKKHNLNPHQLQAIAWVTWQHVRDEYPGVVVPKRVKGKKQGADIFSPAIPRGSDYTTARAATRARYGIQVGKRDGVLPRYHSQISQWQRYKDGKIDYQTYLQRIGSDNAY